MCRACLEAAHGNASSANSDLVARVRSYFGDVTGNDTRFLLDGALDSLKRHGVELEDVDVYWTPGAFEIPATAKRIAEKGKYDAIVCIGPVIRGATPHFEYVANESAKGIAQVGLNTGVPVIYGVITTDIIEQAIERAGTKSGNKGAEAAVTAIEMANLYQQIDEE